jgi:cyclic pyranopterin phosphate synthase
VKLYAFDGIDEQLQLVPLAARRALDAIGVKLSLNGFLSLDLEVRRALASAGSGIEVDKDTALACCADAQPPGTNFEPLVEPNPVQIPANVRSVLGTELPLSEKVWSSLSPLDRYALTKVTERPRPQRVRGAYEELIGKTRFSTHLRPEGGVRMVSIAQKEVSHRRAVAECWIQMSQEAFTTLQSNAAPKGDVLATARLAGIMATKKTSDLIPLCHPLSLQHATIDFEEDPTTFRVRVLCAAEVMDRTGVEMEAMMGAQIAALTIYDMLKSVDRAITLGPGRLLEKSGGRSGHFKGADS